MLPAPSTPQALAILPERTLEERVQAAFVYLASGLKAHGFGCELVEGACCLVLTGHGLILDCALVSAASVVGISGGQSQRLSQATGTDMALRILTTKGGIHGSSEIIHVPLSSQQPVERDVVYNVLWATSSRTGRSELMDAACTPTLQLQ